MVELYGGQGYVELLQTLPATCASGETKDSWIAEAAVLSTSKQVVDVKALLEKLFAWGHFSPFEQAQLSFKVKAPAVVFWQCDRHRTFQYASHIRRSGRYTEFTEVDFYIPAAPDNLRDYTLSAVRQGLAAYKELLATGVKREAARYVLPAFCMLYTEIMSVNLKNLLHFLALREHPAAQPEIQELARGMLQLVGQEFPLTTEIFVKNMRALNYTFEEI